MRTLWAPWRMEYVEDDCKRREEGCLFCVRIAADQDVKNHIVHRSSLSVVIMNKFPYSSGHSMVLPKRHLGELEELDDRELDDLFQTVRLTKKALDDVLRPDGFNIGINLGKVAGAGVPGHLHVHLVPRWDGDHNFMPVLGQTKVIPEYLATTAEKLREAFSRISTK